LLTQTQLNVQIDSHSGSLGFATAFGNAATSYRYDGVGNQTTVVDATGATNYTYYDALGHTVATAAPARASDPSGAATYVPLTTFDHDIFGNVVRTTSYAAGAARADASGYAIAATPVSDQVTYAAYDNFGHLVRTVDPEGAVRFNSYDALGHVVKSWTAI